MKSGEGFLFSNRLAEISRRQMIRAMQLPTRATEQEEEQAMQAESSNGVSKNGVGGGPHRRHYDDEFKADMVARFTAAPSKKAFAKEHGLSPGMLQRWRYEVKKGKPEIPAKPVREPPPVDLARELEVLRQLLELSPAARDRIVAYLTAARTA